MKKVFSKILIIFILLVVCFEFIFSSNISNANVISEDSLNAVTDLAGGIVSIVYWDKRVLATGLAFVLDIIVANLAEADGVNYGNSGMLSIITPFDIFFNKYKLLDVNFFDVNGVSQGSIAHTIRTSVAGWFYTMRLIASAILLVILIYVGIRMAISTIAEEKAKYKKMLIDWCCSLLLIFVLQYIALFAIYCNNAIVNALNATLTDTQIENNISGIIAGIGINAVLGVGIPSIVSVLVFCAIVFQSLAFLLSYISRMIKVGFLIIISPLISLTYSIDKMGDGKAQALGTWLKEFVYTILIQPFHCILYIAFVRTAFGLIVESSALANLINNGLPGILKTPEYNQLVNGVLAILCLKFISDGEKIVRKIFGFQDDNSSTSFVGGMAVGMMAVKNAQKLGTTARKGINFSKNTVNKLGKAVGHDKDLLKNTKVGKALDSFGSKVGNNKVAKAIGSGMGTVGGGIKRGINGFKTINDNFKSSKFAKMLDNRRFGSTSSVLGMMGASMAYMSGGMGAMEAFGLGKGISKGTAELFSSSKSTSSHSVAKINNAEDKKAYDKLGKELEEIDKGISDARQKLIADGGELGDYAALLEKADMIERSEKEDDKEIERLDKDTADKIKQIEKLKRKDAFMKDNNPQIVALQRQIEENGKRADEINRNRKGGAELCRLKADDLDKQNGGELKKKYDEGEVGKLTREKAAKQAEYDTYWDKSSIEQRAKDRNRGATKAEIQKQKNEIRKTLASIILASRQSNTDGSYDNVLNSDERDSVDKTTDWLIENISRGVLTDTGFEVDDDIKRTVQSSLGLSGDTGAAYNDLASAVSDYESLEANNRIAEINNNYTKLGGDKDDITAGSTDIVYNLNKNINKKSEKKSKHSH